MHPHKTRGTSVSILGAALSLSSGSRLWWFSWSLRVALLRDRPVGPKDVNTIYMEAFPDHDCDFPLFAAGGLISTIPRPDFKAIEPQS